MNGIHDFRKTIHPARQKKPSKQSQISSLWRMNKVKSPWKIILATLNHADLIVKWAGCLKILIYRLICACQGLLGYMLISLKHIFYYLYNLVLKNHGIHKELGFVFIRVYQQKKTLVAYDVLYASYAPPS